MVEWTDRTQDARVEKELQEMLSAVLAGDLSRRLDMAGKEGFHEILSRAVNQLTGNMAQVVSRVKQAAGEVHRGAEEISRAMPISPSARKSSPRRWRKRHRPWRR